MVLVLAALVFSFLQERVYVAEAVIEVSPQEDAGTDTGTYVEEVLSVVSTDELVREVMDRAGWEEGEKQLFEERLDPKAFVGQDGESGGVQVRFSAGDPQEAARTANAYATVFVERVEHLNDERLAGGTLAATASLEQRATPPDRPSRPRPLLYMALAAGVGLFAGGALALLIENRTRSWRGVRDAELTLRAPVLGVIPDYSKTEGES